MAALRPVIAPWARPKLLLGGIALIVGSNASVTAFGALLIALATLCVSSYRTKSPV